MAALERFRSQACRIPRSQISLLLRSHRLFSSSSDLPANEPDNQFQADEQQRAMDSAEARNMTREEARYYKDAASSYEKKVAPLPEDMSASQAAAAALNVEGLRIEADSRAARRVFRAVEQEKPLPFPTFIKVAEKKDEQKIIDLQDAIRQVKANAKKKFDETVEAHVNLGIDRRRSDLGVSGSVVLPHGSGKVVRVAVFAEGPAAEEARAAGADVVGGEELIQQIKNGSKLNFDKCIATLAMMKRVAGISKILRGLTPNAKKGTVTDDVAAAVKEAKQGLIDFKMKESIVHVGLGKVSYKEEALRENIGAFVNALLQAKPPGLKKSWVLRLCDGLMCSKFFGWHSPYVFLLLMSPMLLFSAASKYAGYVNSFHLCSTMGPGYQVSIQSLSKAADQYNKSRPQ
ncbi:hypothetical protein V2J09_023446 [Rumex salicifolius]